MTNDADQKLSKNIGRYEAGNYLVTAAIWRTGVGDGFCDTFEIGIRRKEDNKFWLLQSDKYNYQSVQEVANAIAHLIGMPDVSGEHYNPEWCQRYLT